MELQLSLSLADFFFAIKCFYFIPRRFDPDFICNASDNSGRYSYQAQPAICRWNLVKLAEALAPELPPDRAEAVMDEYLDLYNGFYLENMRKKLGLLKKDEPEDEILITELLQSMHNTGGVDNVMREHLVSCSECRAATNHYFNNRLICQFIFSMHRIKQQQY